MINYGRDQKNIPTQILTDKYGFGVSFGEKHPLTIVDIMTLKESYYCPIMTLKGSYLVYYCSLLLQYAQAHFYTIVLYTYLTQTWYFETYCFVIPINFP